MEKENFEELVKRLEEISKELETGNVSFEDGAKLFEEASIIAKKCLKNIADAKLVVEKVNI